MVREVKEVDENLYLPKETVVITTRGCGVHGGKDGGLPSQKIRVDETSLSQFLPQRNG